MSRLIIMSNRVSAPKARSGDPSQGGLAVALGSALRESGGVWFGWSGQVTPAFTGRMHVSRSEGVTTATVDLEDQDVDEVIHLFELHQIRRAPVLNREGRLVGIVSLGDIAVDVSSSLSGEALKSVSQPAEPVR